MGAVVAQYRIVGVAKGPVREPHARRVSAVRAQRAQSLADGCAPGAVWRYN